LRADAKLLWIPDNSFDAEDLDASSDYVRNIEPTLSRQRECYFELLKSVVKDSFLLRFADLFTDTSDVPISITAALAPLSTSFALSNSALAFLTSGLPEKQFEQNGRRLVRCLASPAGVGRFLFVGALHNKPKRPTFGIKFGHGFQSGL
jgi:hypothetical protein